MLKITPCIIALVLCAGIHVSAAAEKNELFLARQKALDQLILKMKKSREKHLFKERIIRDFGNSAVENIIRYREECLTNVLYQLLHDKNRLIRMKALYSLRHTGSVNIAPLLPFLDSSDPLLQDICISTLTEMKDKDSLPFLKSRLDKESNSYIRNSLEYAVRSISQDMPFLFPDFPPGLSTNQVLQYQYYQSGSPIPGYQEKYSQISMLEPDCPQAIRFMPPILQYDRELVFEGTRRSYNVGDGTRHAGDDCGWSREGSSVFSIGDGIIRLVHHSPDWGFLIVIEHKLSATNYVCSIYGHLSGEIRVRPGHLVRMGEKIGTIGLSYSVENGGYGAHLHFAVSRGRWLKSGPDYSHELFLSEGDQVQKVKEYRLNEKGMELIFENGMKLELQRSGADLQQRLFWLKGYAFSRDLERTWLDPKEFLESYRDR
ncbi:MAG: peptidoglycan DD-metalloendopeptidase family protein [bacterium]|nr:peptidoglycan DD-metalloendopeptidase family protein [bacterium]